MKFIILIFSLFFGLNNIHASENQQALSALHSKLTKLLPYCNINEINIINSQLNELLDAKIKRYESRLEKLNSKINDIKTKINRIPDYDKWHRCQTDSCDVSKPYQDLMSELESTTNDVNNLSKRILIFKKTLQN